MNRNGDRDLAFSALGADVDGRVLDANDSAIPGPYAVGVKSASLAAGAHLSGIGSQIARPPK